MEVFTVRERCFVPGRRQMGRRRAPAPGTRVVDRRGRAGSDPRWVVGRAHADAVKGGGTDW